MYTRRERYLKQPFIRVACRLIAAWLLCGWLLPAVACAQARDSGYIVVDTILVSGNDKTKSTLILRELTIHQGDTLPVAGLQELLDFNALRVLNLKLFLTCTIEPGPAMPGNRRPLLLKVQETWFLLPVPVFAFADRNFNVWVHEYKGSLKRVNYGLDLSHNNLTGYGDRLKSMLVFGYSNQYSFSYRLPPLNKKQTLFLQGGYAYTRQHEVAYTTLNNKLQFYKDPNVWVFRQQLSNATLTWRPGLYTTHSWSAEYRATEVVDTIRAMNPDFFLNNQTRQKHFSFVYNLTIDHRDIQPYPLNGWMLVADVRRNGLPASDNLQLWRFYLEGSRYFPIIPHLYADLSARVRTTAPRDKVPYFNNQGLGYVTNYVRGYEYFVSDGLDYLLVKTSLHVELLNRTFQLSKAMPFPIFRALPLKLYLSVNNDVGYANDPYYTTGNPLVNRPLYGYGLGFDIVAWYNKTARFEYSWNDLGKGGLYIRIDAGF